MSAATGGPAPPEPVSGLLLPAPDEDSAPFWSACLEGELRMQACAGCARRRFPPRPLCPWCGSFELGWDLMSGQGTVWSVVIPHPPLLPAYGEQAPYNVVLVTLDDDPSLRLVGNVIETPSRLVGNVIEAGSRLDSVDPHSVRIGEAVRVVFDRVAPDVALPRWCRA